MQWLERGGRGLPREDEQSFKSALHQHLTILLLNQINQKRPPLMELVILIGLVSATAAGFACAAEHGYAEKHGWKTLERYGVGAATWLLGFAPPLFAALPIEQAVLLYGMAWLVIGGMGLGTFVSYRPPLAMPEEDELEKKINRALGEK